MSSFPANKTKLKLIVNWGEFAHLLHKSVILLYMRYNINVLTNKKRTWWYANSSCCDAICSRTSRVRSQPSVWIHPKLQYSILYSLIHQKILIQTTRLVGYKTLYASIEEKRQWPKFADQSNTCTMQCFKKKSSYHKKRDSAKSLQTSPIPVPCSVLRKKLLSQSILQTGVNFATETKETSTHVLGNRVVEKVTAWTQMIIFSKLQKKGNLPNELPSFASEVGNGDSVVSHCPLSRSSDSSLIE